MPCPQSKRCSLYAQLGTRSALTVWQTLFCESGFDRCIRYRMTAIGAVVPADLLPDGRTHLPTGPRPPLEAPGSKLTG
jgi:hypothetical protein